MPKIKDMLNDPDLPPEIGERNVASISEMRRILIQTQEIIAKKKAAMKQPLLIDLSNVDWKLLREQKRGLVEIGFKPDNAKYNDVTNGLLNLIDHLQDETEKQLGSKKVFG